MSEPAGLGLSLDDLIKRNAAQNAQTQQRRGGGGRAGGGRGGGRSGRSSGSPGLAQGRPLGVHGGGVSKVRSPPVQQQRGQGGGRGAQRPPFNNGAGDYGGSPGYASAARGGGAQRGWPPQTFRPQQPQQQGPPRTHFQQPAPHYDGMDVILDGGPGHVPVLQRLGPREPVHTVPSPASRPAPRSQPLQPQQPAVSYPALEVWADEDTGNVVATCADVNVVTVTPEGTVLLDTGGYWEDATFAAINEALSAISMKVSLSGPVADPRSWSAADAVTMRKFTGNTCVLPPKGPASSGRAELLFNAYNHPDLYALNQQASAAAITAFGGRMGSSGAAAVPTGLATGAGGFSVPAPVFGRMGGGGGEFGLHAGQPATFGHGAVSRFPVAGRMGAPVDDSTRRLYAQGRMQ